MFNHLDHIAIVVRDTDEALTFYRDVLGLPVLVSEIVNDPPVRLTHLDMGNTQLQLVQPIDSDHPLQQFLSEQGEGLHHLCFRVADVPDAMQQLPDYNLKARSDTPHNGPRYRQAAFIDPSDTRGILFELTGDSVLTRIQEQQRPQTVFVLDDDPTGTQTVYDVPVLTTWDNLKDEFNRKTVYILTNSRSLPPEQARSLNQQIGQAIHKAANGRPYTLISRSDSTLRGHFPLETDTLLETYPADNLLLIPAFFEGERQTINDIHYTGGVPAGETEFARDASFGYQSSNLKEWVEEKTDGAIPADAVASISLEDIRSGNALQRLLELEPKQVCIINAETYQDLERATLGILQAEQQGRRYLFRTAASFVRTYSGLGAKPLLTDIFTENGHGGLIVVGSYVEKTTKQLQHLRETTDIAAIEIEVEPLLKGDKSQLETCIENVNRYLRQGQDVVVYTGRTLITGDNASSSLNIGSMVSEGLIELVQRIEVEPRYMIAKGGITSSNVATKGLDVKRAMVRGQILPGVPVWELGSETRFPGMNYIVFPGNVGSADALTRIVKGG
jgi:methylmalonyl-CoA epimerase